jgi:hypothetical protein
MANNLTGQKLKEIWHIPANHVLYLRKGNWYHLLERFPGALCDPNGYIVFDTKEQY